MASLGTQEVELTVEVSFDNGALLTAHEKMCLPIEMRTMPTTEQTLPIELHIDKGAFSNAVADALERVAQQIRGNRWPGYSSHPST